MLLTNMLMAESYEDAKVWEKLCPPSGLKCGRCRQYFLRNVGVPTCESTRCQNAENQNIPPHCSEKLKSQVLYVNSIQLNKYHKYFTCLVDACGVVANSSAVISIRIKAIFWLLRMFKLFYYNILLYQNGLFVG